jgi:potassium-transporting ATPase ATP-binding subunit
MTQTRSMWHLKMVERAILDAFYKLVPGHQLRNPVLFSVYVSCLFTIALFIQACVAEGEAPLRFILAIMLWLWFTLLFANFAEAMAEARGKAQAQALRQSRREIQAKKLRKASREAKIDLVPSEQLITGDIVLVEAGDFIPSDGEVIEGIASVNESAITGESAPVIRESDSDRCAVTGGTQVTSDWLIVRISTNPGETFLDHMIALIEGTKRQKTPNELALTI